MAYGTPSFDLLQLIEATARTAVEDGVGYEEVADALKHDMEVVPDE